MDFRPMTEADLDACADVFYSADDDLMAQRGLSANPRNRVALVRLFAHISTGSAQRAWVATQSDQVVGFGMAAQRDDLTFLSFLFVQPGRQERGIGQALLDRCMAESDYRAVCIFSAQPVSAALYARYGMLPLVPMYTFAGRPRTGLPELPAPLQTAEFEIDAAVELDREVTGFSRPMDHAAWRAWDRRPFGLYDQGRLIGYGYGHQSGRIGPFVVRREELLLPFLGTVVRNVAPVDAWTLNVPGPATATFAPLLHAGMRLEGPPIIFCASRRRIDHARYLPSTYALP